MQEQSYYGDNLKPSERSGDTETQLLEWVKAAKYYGTVEDPEGTALEVMSKPPRTLSSSSLGNEQVKGNPLVYSTAAGRAMTNKDDNVTVQ